MNLDAIAVDPMIQHQYDIEISSETNSASLNLPSQYLLAEGNRREYLEIGFPLYEASVKGDWKAAKEILDKKSELVRVSINERNETALHVAVFAGKSVTFVKNLIKLMSHKDIELRNNYSETALCIAASSGNVEMAKILVSSHNALIDMTGGDDMTPLHMAALSGKYEIVDYMYEKSDKMRSSVWTDDKRGSVLCACVEVKLYGAAIKIMKDHPVLAVREGTRILGVLASQPEAFYRKQNNCIKILVVLYKRCFGHVEEGTEAMQVLRMIWGKIIELPTPEIYDVVRGPPDTEGKYFTHALFVAANLDNGEFIGELIRKCPQLVLERNEKNQTIFHVAVVRRHASVYSLLDKVNSFKSSITNSEDEDGNNLLHLVAKLKEPYTCNQYQDHTPVLEMRRELVWFEKVEGTISPRFHKKKNKAGLTPREIFHLSHTELLLKCVKWTKTTTMQLMAFTLILAAIGIAGSVTIGGGYNQDTVKPIFLQFMVLSFISAAIAIYQILCITTSNHGEREFFLELPKKLTSVIMFLLPISTICLILSYLSKYFLLYKGEALIVPSIAAIVCFITIVLFFKWVVHWLMPEPTSSTQQRPLFKYSWK